MSLGHIKYSNILRESFHLVSLRCDSYISYNGPISSQILSSGIILVLCLTRRYSKSKIGHIKRSQIVLVLGLPLLTQFILLQQSTGYLRYSLLCR